MAKAKSDGKPESKPAEEHALNPLRVSAAQSVEGRLVSYGFQTGAALIVLHFDDAELVAESVADDAFDPAAGPAVRANPAYSARLVVQSFVATGRGVKVVVKVVRTEAHEAKAPLLDELIAQSAKAAAAAE